VVRKKSGKGVGDALHDKAQDFKKHFKREADNTTTTARIAGFVGVPRTLSAEEEKQREQRALEVKKQVDEFLSQVNRARRYIRSVNKIFSNDEKEEAERHPKEWMEKQQQKVFEPGYEDRQIGFFAWIGRFQGKPDRRDQVFKAMEPYSAENRPIGVPDVLFRFLTVTSALGLLDRLDERGDDRQAELFIRYVTSDATFRELGEIAHVTTGRAHQIVFETRDRLWDMLPAEGEPLSTNPDMTFRLNKLEVFPKEQLQKDAKAKWQAETGAQWKRPGVLRRRAEAIRNSMTTEEAHKRLHDSAQRGWDKRRSNFSD
jgi:hypothetical protein